CNTTTTTTTTTTTNPDDEEYKIFLFWSVYFIDKSLSLRLGRPSTIQDYDVTAPYPSSASKMHGALMSYFCPETIAADDNHLPRRPLAPPPGSATTFGTECINAARATLQRHEDCMAIMAKDAYYPFPMYMNWTILFSPFVPFIVTFCQVIETSDTSDLARLQGLVTSIQGAKEFTEASARLYRLFQVLL
ncbi:fungal specific transcription factor, partial [Colletotrichum salicis]